MKAEDGATLIGILAIGTAVGENAPTTSGALWGAVIGLAIWGTMQLWKRGLL